MKEIRFHGRGGQGAVTAVDLLAQAVIADGKYAQGFPNFGPERRGAPVTAYLRVSNQPIYLRESIEKPDATVVLDASLMELIDVCEGLKPGGILLVNTAEQKKSRLLSFCSRYRVGWVDASRIAKETLGVPITNTAIIGALLKVLPLAGIDYVREPLEKRFDKLAEKNMCALNRAYQETRFVEISTEPVPENEVTDCRFTVARRKKSLMDWKTLTIGCDIDRPGNSTDFYTGNWRTAGRPVIDLEKCIRCGFCWVFCPDDAYQRAAEGAFRWDERYCKGCGICAAECPKSAINMREEA